MNGVLEVETTVRSTGAKAERVVERGKRTMSPEQIVEARKARAGLKIHPRTALPNTTALARADALFIELTGGERDRLGRGVAAFRAVLEAQEPQSIDRARGYLIALVAELRALVG